MIRCSNESCDLGVWYHLICAELKKAPEKHEDWFCSPECIEKNSSPLCSCKMVKPDAEYILCSNEKCQHGYKFHLECLDLDRCPGKISNKYLKFCEILWKLQNTFVNFYGNMKI